MANKRFVVELGADERARLNELISKGKASAKAILKARILLKADQGEDGEGWSKPPEGHARWTLRLLADKVVELEIVPAAHFNTVGRALKKTISSRT